MFFLPKTNIFPYVRNNIVMDKENTANIQLKHAFAGGLSGALTRGICQPLDMIKIRFQLQVEPLNYSQTTSKYNSIIQASRLIRHEEGIRGFWKGHNPAQILSILYGISQFWCYEQLHLAANDYTFLHNHTAVTNFICGGLAGAVGTLTSSPLDVVRTRLIAQDDKKKGYSNSYQGLKQIVRVEGIRGLYRGVVPALIQVAPLSGANFMFYKLFCDVFQKSMNYKSVK